MKRTAVLGLALLLGFSACSDQPADPLQPAERANESTVRVDKSIDVTNRYIVVFKSGVNNADRFTDELTRGNGSTVHYRYRHALKGFAATIPAQALEGIRHNPNIAIIEKEVIMTAGAQASPPSWGLDRVDQRSLPLNALYDYPNTGSGVTVYIIDTGIRMDHQEFGNRARSGWDFIDNDADASDCHGHGTHVAGTVGGTTVGIAKTVSLVGVRVLDCGGSGTSGGVIAGVDWVTNQSRPAVANMSLGGGYSATLNQAVANSIAAGVVYAVSAGNSNADASTASPASTPTAITVGASTNTDTRSSFSNYGSLVDIFAPGSAIYSSTMTGTNTYASWSGTSMSCPHVAGAAALILSANPNATPAQVATTMTTSATANLLSGIGTGSPNLLLYVFTSTQVGTPPAAPSALSVVNPTASSLTLTWSDNASDETGFTVERAAGSSGPWSQIATIGANAGTGSMSFVNSGLQSGTSYWYRVNASNTHGSSAYTAAASGSTTTTATLPNAPSSLVISNATNSSLDLTWFDNASDESGFYVERAAGSSGPWSLIASIGANSGTGNVSFVNTGLASSTTYWYRLRAWNASGSSAYSAVAGGTTTTSTLRTVHVATVSGFANGNSNSWYATMLVTIRDAQNAAVSGATVSVSWPGGSLSAVTNSAGQASINSSRFKKNTYSVTMTVTDVSGPGMVYVAPSAAPSVTVYKP